MAITARSRNDVGDRDRFFGAPPLGILRAALADFDDFDVAKTEGAADRFGALAIGRGELAFGALLEAADGGDEDTHDVIPRITVRQPLFPAKAGIQSFAPKLRLGFPLSRE